MALNQKLDEILLANSQFQLKIGQLEIQLNLITNFLKLQFGDDFLLNNDNSNGIGGRGQFFSIDAPKLELVEVSTTNQTNQNSNYFVDNQYQEELHNNNKRNENININSIPRKTKAAGHDVDYVFEDAQPIDNSRITNEHEEDEELIDLTEEQVDEEEIKVELDPLDVVIDEQNSPYSSNTYTNDNSIQVNDPLEDVVLGFRSSSKKPFVCSWLECKRQFGTRAQLKRHLRSHTGEKPFPCDWPGCAQRFSERAGCTAHKRTHTGEKPYKCDWPKCGQRFSLLGVLTTHKRIHTGEKPCKCDWIGCGESFRHRSSLRNHKKIHNTTATRLVQQVHVVVGEIPFNI